MESSNATIRWIIHVFLLILLLGFTNCSKEVEEIPPPDGHRDTLVVETIGSDGGIIEIDSLSITIPVGAFSNNQILELSISDQQHPFAQQEVTELFQIKGIPADFTEPLTLALKYEGDLTEESYIAFGLEQIPETQDIAGISFDLLECIDSAGFLTGNLMPFGQNSHIKTIQNRIKGLPQDPPDDLTAFIKGVTNFKPYKSEDSPFLISYAASLAIEPRFLSFPNYLDLNYLILMLPVYQVFGDSFNIPDQINVYDNTGKNNIYNKRCFNYLVLNGRVSPGNQHNECFIYTLYKDQQEESEINLEIGDAFYKSFQRFIFSGRRPEPDWFSKASRVWMEEKFYESWGSIDTYIPESLQGYVLTPFLDWWKADANAGMAPVVKYLAENYGDKVVFQYHYHIWKDKSMKEALSLAVGKPVDEWFPEFIKDYLEGKVYGITGSQFETGIAASYNLPQMNSPQSHEDDYNGLSAKMIRYSTKGTENSNTGIKFSVLSKDVAPDMLGLQVFSMHRSDHSIGFLTNHYELEAEVADLNDLDSQNKDLLVVVVNSDIDKLDKESTITLTAELSETMPLNYRKFYIDLRYFSGEVEYEDGTTKTFNDIRMQLDMPDAVFGKFTGNSFNAEWEDVTEGFSSDSGHAKVNLMELEEEIVLFGFDFLKVVENSDTNSKYAYSLSGGGFPLYLIEGKQITTGRVEGEDVESHITGFTWKVERYDENHNLKDGSYTIKNIQFNTESYLQVYFTYPVE